MTPRDDTSATPQGETTGFVTDPCVCRLNAGQWRGLPNHPRPAAGLALGSVTPRSAAWIKLSVAVLWTVANVIGVRNKRSREPAQVSCFNIPPPMFILQTADLLRYLATRLQSPSERGRHWKEKKKMRNTY